VSEGFGVLLAVAVGVDVLLGGSPAVSALDTPKATRYK
jgi:hypothetical protein